MFKLSARHAPKWSASRIVAKYHQFSWANVRQQSDSEPIYFLGEMVWHHCNLDIGFTDSSPLQILPDMFDDYANLRPLKNVAEILANDESWGPLYDLKQLAKNEVKVTAAT
jgi:hypothetical protein